MKIEPMTRKDEGAVRDLFVKCHAGWPRRPNGWFVAYPTLIAVEDGQVVGFTSFSVGNYTGLIMLTGQDLCVDPDYQGCGIGKALHLARVALGKGIGARMWSGITQPENKAMIAIFEQCGYHACQPAPGYFYGEDGVVYVGTL